jgi:hypothetical protein
MKNLKYILLVGILCFSFRSVFADTQTNLSELNKTCLVAFVNMKSKKMDFCKCYTNNMSRLIHSSQFQPLLKWLKNEMSDSEQDMQEPLIDLDYEVSSECVKNPTWIAPKILVKLKKK